MQLHQLEYFVAVARRRHFTRAAGELHVAQPSVSKQIRKLEAEVATPLFHRMKGNVVLTPAGEALLPWAERILGEVDGALAAVAELGGLLRGRLAIGATPSLCTIMLPPVLAAFHTTYPGIELVLQQAGSRDLVRRLDDGALDLALVILPVEHAIIDATPLLEEELVLAAPPGHPLARKRAIAVADLEGVPLVMFRDGYDLRSVTEAACRAAGFEPTFALEGGEMDSVLRLAEAGIGAAVVPAMVVAPGGPLRAVRFSAPGLSRTIGMANRRDRPLSRAARAFAASLSDAVA
jgi:DNA-binding transcriptional LysR family regulator